MNFEFRMDRLSALHLLEEFRRLEEFYFHAGNNPGGTRGLLTSDVWFRTLREFPAVRLLSRGVLDDSTDNLRASINSLLQTQYMPISDDAAYLFPFKVRDRVYVYVVAPAVPRSRVPRLILREDMAVTDYQTLAISCAKGACRDGAFPELSKFVASFRTLQVQGRAGDLEFHRLFNRPDLSVHYFYDGFQPPRPYRAAFQGAYRGSCSSPAGTSDATPVVFTDSLLQGVYGGFVFFWPSDLDARLGEEGERRPVYLRNFACGEGRVRFWDLDRFWASPPELIVFQKRRDEPDVDRAFLRFAAGAGVVLIEAVDWQKEHSEFIRTQAKSGASYPQIQDRLRKAFPDLDARFYFPGPVLK